jgi:hypothetical protein
MMFVNRDTARLQLVDPLFINVGANDLMAGFRQARAGHQTHITTSNYRKTQAVLLTI